MQFSHYCPDESIGSHGLRPASTIAGDHLFAKAAVDEKSALLSKVGLQDRTQSARQRIRQSFKGTGKMGFVWMMEVIMFICTILFIAYEFWTSCTRDVGMPHCYGCYTSAFLTWSSIWVCLWVTHLYTFLLLTSRDFEMYVGGGILSELMTNVLDRGIPRQGVVFYVAESVLLIFWWVVGIGVLISSNSCLAGGRIYGNAARSGLMFFWVLISVIVWIPLMIFGRFTMAPAKYLYKQQVEEKRPVVIERAPPAPEPAPAPEVVESFASLPFAMPALPAPAPVSRSLQAPVLHPVAQPVMRSMPALPAQPVMQSMPAAGGGSVIIM